MSVIVVQQTRGPLVENINRGDAAVVDGAGQKATFWRSSARPVLAMPVVLSGASRAFGYESRHLALFSASHNGEPVHTELVVEALQRAAGAVGGVGVAVKAEGGSNDVRHLMLVEIMRQLGLMTESDLAALERYRCIAVRNWAGTPVGEMRSAAFNILTADVPAASPRPSPGRSTPPGR